jgi:tRNA pseudouridine55 synthase
MKIINKNSEYTRDEIIELASSEGVAILIDKEKDWTSFDVVAKLRSYFRIKKVGHAGTLDPAATGLLIIGLGKATKSLTELTALNKSYSGTIEFGATTPTDDAESEKEKIIESFELIESEILLARDKFLGEIEQLPPKFSAKKIKGKKMYDMARKGIEFERKPSLVTVNRFDISNITENSCDFYIDCTKGTYIRALARDLGAELGFGGFLKSLRREKIDEYNVADAPKINDFLDGLK